jgi:hypothetical protein
MKRVLVYLVLALFLSGCATQDRWYKSIVREPGKFDPLVLVTNDFPTSCDERDWGCYVPEDIISATPARIYIKKGLSIWDYTCVLKHETKHHDGFDHPKGYSDC